jgi:S1-C subfamily serine protease
VVGGDVSPNLAEAMGLPVDYGAYISEVVEDGPAAQSGLHGSLRDTVFEGRQLTIGGDVITAINGVNVDSFGDLLVYIAMNVMPGDEVSLTVFSDGKYEDIKVTLQERPEQLDISEVQFP